MLTTVLGIFLLVVSDLNFTINRKIDQLPDRHAFINFHRLLYRYFQSPVAAKANITLTGSGMYIYS